jgi:hypothetical protein
MRGMLSLTPFSPKKCPHSHSPPCRTALAAVGSAIFLQLFGQPLQAASFALYGDPDFPFGASSPDVATMAIAIQSRMNIPITVVSSLPNENTAFAPLQASSATPPFFVFGPSAVGTIKNLNLNAPIVTGLTSGELRSAGLELDGCGDSVERFVLRAFSATEFYDVLVRPATCSGISNVVWSFFQVSGARPNVSPTPTPSPTPFPVHLVSTVSRFTHGAAGTFDVNLPLAGPPGIECRRTISDSGSYTIVYTFSETLNSVFSASVTSGLGRVHDSGIGADPHEYIVNLVNVSNAQSIVVTLNFVQDSEGHVSNTVSAAMSVLVGDTTGNGNVGSGDVRQVRAHVRQLVTAVNFRNDVNHDGVINGNDVNLVKKRRRTSLPQ